MSILISNYKRGDVMRTKYALGKRLEAKGMKGADIAKRLGYTNVTSWYSLKSRLSMEQKKKNETGFRLERFRDACALLEKLCLMDEEVFYVIKELIEDVDNV